MRMSHWRRFLPPVGVSLWIEVTDDVAPPMWASGQMRRPAEFKNINSNEQNHRQSGLQTVSDGEFGWGGISINVT